MDNATTDVDLLRDEIATLRKEMEVLRAQQPAAPTAASAEVDPPQSNRRGFLKLAGAAAVGATAVAVAGTAQQAAATSGQPLNMGVGSQAPTLPTDKTRMFNPSGSNLMPTMMHLDNYTNQIVTLPSTARIALAATSSGDDAGAGDRTGVYGRTISPAGVGGQGVFGSAEGDDNSFMGSFTFGVFGSAKDGGFGVYGVANTGAGSTGVKGRADAGTGVTGHSLTGLSVYAEGSGRILQALRSTAGAPTTGSFFRGEQIRDLNGDMYICTTSGTPGTWRRVGTGGGVNLLPTPIRLLDTRPGSSAPLNNGFVKFAGNTVVTLQISGTVVAGLSVPAGALGILGNLTIIGPTGDGYAQVWPSGAAPTTSNINYGAVNASPALANYFVSGLTAAGKVNVLTYASAHVLLDVSGYLY